MSGSNASATAPKPRNASAVVVGAGDFIGAEIAKKFAAEGYIVFIGRRQAEKLDPLKAEIEAAGGRVVARGLDARDEDQVVAFFEEAERAAPIEVSVFNVGANVRFALLETTSRVFRKVWEMACFAGFLSGREAARHMVPRRRRFDLLHRRDRRPARRLRVRRVRERQIRPSGRGPVGRSGTRSARHPCAAFGDRLRRRHRLGA